MGGGGFIFFYNLGNMFRGIKKKYNHTHKFFQEYLRIFECQIYRYERTKEYMNANHKYETRVKTNAYIEYEIRKKKGD